MVKGFLYKVFCGFFLGISVFAPGFSGSIVAIIMGIYEDLIRIISNPFKQLKQNIVFCIPLAIGVAVSAVLFIIAFKYLFDTYEKATYMLFIGLIAGNLPVIWAEVKKCGFKKHYLAGGGCAFAAAIALGFFASGIGILPDAESVTSSLSLLALGGLAGGVMALVPGMSVSMILIIIGVYSQVIYIADMLLHLNFAYLLHFAVFCLCAVVGLVAASSGIKAVLARFPGFANSVVFGFVAGSLIGVLIQSARLEDADFNWLTGGIMLAAGLGLSVLFVFVGRAVKKTSSEER